MNEVLYECSSCGFPVVPTVASCPNCSSSFKSVGQVTSGGVTMEVMVAAGVALAVGFIIGISIGKK